MTIYTHTTMPGIHGNAPFVLNEVQYPRVWWRTASEQEIADLGFVPYVAPVSDPPTLSERKQILTDALKQKRWEVETGGVTVPINGEEVLVSTARGDDRTNLHVMMTTITNGMRQDGATFNFADSKPRSVSNADMLTAIGAVLSHVQSAFDKEAEITNEINAANTHAKLDLALDKINEVW
jgi:hypothetical protein